MNRKNCLFVCLAAGTACSASALAQSAATGTVLKELPDGTTVRVPSRMIYENLTQQSGGFGERSVTVLDNVTGAGPNPTRTILSTTHILDDFSFAPGPWATATNRVADTITLTFWFAQWDGTTSPAANIRFRFFNAPAFATTLGASMIPAGATVAGNLVLGLDAGDLDDSPPGVGFLTTRVTTFDLDITPGSEDLLFSGNSFLIECSVEDPANATKFAWIASAAGQTTPVPLYIPTGENTTAPRQLFGFTSMLRPPSPGSAPDVGYGRDMNLNGTFTYAPLVAGGGFTTTDNRDYRNSGGISLIMAMTGNVVPTPPAADVDLGCLSDGNTDAVITGRAPGGFKTIKFCLNGDASDAQRRFLDIIGDNANGTDFSIGVFNAATGALIGPDAIDDNSGDSATGAPQLSFGVGRRAKVVSTGQPLDGHNGELLAGTYYALVSGPGAGFGDGYIVSVPDVSLDAGGDETIHFRTNVNAGALAPSVAPDPADYGGSAVTLPPSFASAQITVNPQRVVWFSLDVCENVSDSANGEFLDIDMGRAPGATNTQILLFDSSGNLVAENDDSGTSTKSELSFSDPAATPRIPNGAGMAALAGQNGTLAAGTYYLAIGGRNGANGVSHLVAGDRFHVRAKSGNLDLPSFDINTNIDCTEETGCPCVADFDLSGGTPDASDIDAFFGAWLLGDPSADSDCSGGTPDASDIDQFFTEWLAGGC